MQPWGDESSGIQLRQPPTSVLFDKTKAEPRISGENVVAVSQKKRVMPAREPRACCGSLGARHKRGCAEAA